MLRNATRWSHSRCPKVVWLYHDSGEVWLSRRLTSAEKAALMADLSSSADWSCLDDPDALYADLRRSQLRVIQGEG